ncbi:MAG: hypothetical protein KAT68_01125 [Bacteroidales bacterium]|nr:hypothetical protein [Bacteroidales bacterium]
MFFSCNKDETPTTETNIDYGYFPYQTGDWITYDVVEINIDRDSEVFDTIYYQVKELIESTFIDDAGDETFRIEIYKRTDSTYNWDISDVWYANLYTNAAHKIEENIRYVKIIFPAKLELKWNGNAYNTLDTLNRYQYEITKIDEHEIINEFEFDSVLTVTQKYDSSLVQKILYAEKYAKNTGLIYKEEVDINSQIIDINVPIEERISKGTIKRMKISGYGNNI